MYRFKLPLKRAHEMPYDRRLREAAACYQRRQPDDNGKAGEYPDGREARFWGHDVGWIPSVRWERRLCCDWAYQRNRRLFDHCRRPQHVAVLYNVNAADLREREALGLPQLPDRGWELVKNFDP
jgi:hypothetical protein